MTSVEQPKVGQRVDSRVDQWRHGKQLTVRVTGHVITHEHIRASRDRPRPKGKAERLIQSVCLEWA